MVWRDRGDPPLIKYVCSNPQNIDLSVDDEITLTMESILKAVLETNRGLSKYMTLQVAIGWDTFEILKLRNLSSFIGEAFAERLQKNRLESFIMNPNQDGQPDLIALNSAAKLYIDTHTTENGTINPDKNLWSPAPYGGVEVKNTFGNTPSARVMEKPLIYESRWSILVNAEWKAHHQQTPILLGLHTDFVEGYPTIVAAFYRNNLDDTIGKENQHWPVAALPKEGSKTTSVCVMKKAGVLHMGKGLCLIIDDEEIRTALNNVYGFDDSKYERLTVKVLDTLLLERGLSRKYKSKSVRIEKLLHDDINITDIESLDSHVLERALRERGIVPTGNKVEDVINALLWCVNTN